MKKLISLCLWQALLGLWITACRNGGNAPQLQSSVEEGEAPAPVSVPTVDAYENVLIPAATEAPETLVPQVTPSPQPIPIPQAPFFPESCAAIRKARPDALSGPYKIYLDANLPTRVPLDASCDMQTDGGGWTLLLSYNHKGGTTPALAIRTQNLPLLGSDILGDDESAKSLFWGHAAEALFAKFTSARELRFFCRSSQTTRVMHFKTSDASCLTAAKTGQGSCLTIRNGFTALAGHTATLPAAIDRADSNRVGAVLTFNSFGRVVDNAADAMWSLAGDGGNSWECDFGSDSSAFDTIHRVWFR